MPDLHYSASGSGLPLVVLHGLFGSGKNWQSHARRFAEHFEVVNVDLRNHGQSFHADEMNYEVMASDVVRLLQRLGFDRCHILGHSMGGKVAMTMALQNPGLFETMIIADIAPVAYDHHYDDLIEPILALRLDQLESRAEADRLLSRDIADDQLRAFLLQNLARETDGWRWRVNWAVIQREMEALTGFIELTDHSVVELPTLFLLGANSDYVDAAAAEVIERHFIDSRIETIENAGHWLHAENPDSFNRRALNFLLAN